MIDAKKRFFLSLCGIFVSLSFMWLFSACLPALEPTSSPKELLDLTPTLERKAGEWTSPTSTATLMPAADSTSVSADSANATPTAELFKNIPSATSEEVPAILLTQEAFDLPQVFLPVGPGGSDVIPHQIVRGYDDHLYLFSIQSFSPLIRLFTTVRPGLPNTSEDFFLLGTVSEDGLPISIDAVHDGRFFIHLLANTKDTGQVVDYPFDISTRTFRERVLIADDSHTLEGYYGGTSGISGMVDKNGLLHLVYWTGQEEIRHLMLRYDVGENRFIQEGEGTLLSSKGSSNHPVIAISPKDNSVIAAWVNSENGNNTIQVTLRALGRDWGEVMTVSRSPVWTSTSAGINIDQGPSMLVDANGIVHLAYIENYDATGDYGRVHHVSNSNGWVDEALSFYSHDPALALNSRGELYLIGHGHPNNTSCKSMDDMCTVLRRADGSWADPQVFAAHQGDASFDGSPSVKWSVVGFNRPETVEFVFFQIRSGDYNDATLYYGRLP